MVEDCMMWAEATIIGLIVGGLIVLVSGACRRVPKIRHFHPQRDKHDDCH